MPQEMNIWINATLTSDFLTSSGLVCFWDQRRTWIFFKLTSYERIRIFHVLVPNVKISIPKSDNNFGEMSFCLLFFHFLFNKNYSFKLKIRLHVKLTRLQVLLSIDWKLYLGTVKQLLKYQSFNLDISNIILLHLFNTFFLPYF